jgi:hypothetical protein
MKKIFFVTMIFGTAFLNVSAQYYYDRSKNPEKIVANKPGRDFDHFFFLSWDGNTPMSNPDFIKQSSSLGTKFGFRKRLNDEDRLWVGGDLGWAVYKQYIPTQTFTTGTKSLTTDLYNYSYNYSLTANLDYFLFPMKKLIVPYGGLGVGFAYDKFSQYYNIYGSTGDSWGLQVRPEVGVLIGFRENSSWRIKAAAHYDYASNSFDLSSNKFIPQGSNKYSNFMSIGFQIGLVKMAW